jgi:hypothetical protein
LLHEPNERFLHHVLGPVAQLLRVEHQRSTVLIQ